MTSDFQFAVVNVDEILENKLERTLFFPVVFRKRQNFGKLKLSMHLKKSQPSTINDVAVHNGKVMKATVMCNDCFFKSLLSFARFQAIFYVFVFTFKGSSC